MSIEVRELVIRAVVEPQPAGAAERRPDEGLDREKLIETCVAETLRILRRLEER
jgi:hypothetical protein